MQPGLAGGSVRVKLEVHISETTSLQMSCAAALVAVMGKLHWEEGHTQLESGESVSGGEGDTGGVKEGQTGTRREGPPDKKWFSWKLAFCALGKCCSLVCWLGPVLARLSDSSPDVNQISTHLQLICPCHSQYPLSASDGVAQREGRDRGKEGEREEGEGGRVTYCSLSPWMSSAHLSPHSGGTEWRRRGGREEILRSVVWLTSTCK